MSVQKLRGGFTTGSCAAAAAKAAAITAYTGKSTQMVMITLPAGDDVSFDVVLLEHADASAKYHVIKDAGDDPDITNGLAIVAQVVTNDTGEIIIRGGSGVGKVTKAGLQIPVGAPAINPVPLHMIQQEIRSVLPESLGAVVTLSIPGGVEAAKRTMNPRLGIVDGISIIGTSGRVRPMSDDAWMKSLIPQLDIARSAKYKEILMVPGQIGEKLAAGKFAAAGEMIVQTANFIGVMLDEAARRNFTSVLLMGHHGKLLKLAGGIFNTHSKIADARAEIVAAHAALCGANQALIAEIMDTPTAEGMLAVLRTAGLIDEVYASIAEAGAQKCRTRMLQSNSDLIIYVALFDYAGNLLAQDRALADIGGIQGWLMKYSL